MPSLDLDFVRTQFPAFAQAEMQGQVFLENAGGSFMCKPVMDRLTRFYHTRKVQPYYAYPCLLYTSPSPRDQRGSRMPSSA